MTRKEKTQQNRFDTKILPLLTELSKLCEKFEMPMLASVQLFEHIDKGARVETIVGHTAEMSLPLLVSTSILNGTTTVKVKKNSIELTLAKDTEPNSTDEPLLEHAAHCATCAILLEDALEKGENIDNIFVPPHEDMELSKLLQELQDKKLLFVTPTNNNIH